jgi:hypothetical protein
VGCSRLKSVGVHWSPQESRNQQEFKKPVVPVRFCGHVRLLWVDCWYGTRDGRDERRLFSQQTWKSGNCLPQTQSKRQIFHAASLPTTTSLSGIGYRPTADAGSGSHDLHEVHPQRLGWGRIQGSAMDTVHCTVPRPRRTPHDCFGGFTGMEPVLAKKKKGGEERESRSIDSVIGHLGTSIAIRNLVLKEKSHVDLDGVGSWNPPLLRHGARERDGALTSALILRRTRGGARGSFLAQQHGTWKGPSNACTMEFPTRGLDSSPPHLSGSRDALVGSYSRRISPHYDATLLRLSNISPIALHPGPAISRKSSSMP